MDPRWAEIVHKKTFWPKRGMAHAVRGVSDGRGLEFRWKQHNSHTGGVRLMTELEAKPMTSLLH